VTTTPGFGITSTRPDASPEFYGLFVGRRGWAPAAFEAWLADTWIRLLLAP